MNMLDIRTLMLCFLLTAVIGTWVMYVLWRQNRLRFSGIEFWIFDYLLLSVGLSLIFLRGYIPDWTSIILSNTFLITGVFMGYMGLAIFLNRKPYIWPNLILIGFFILVLTWYTLVDNNLRIRTAAIGFTSFVLFLQYVCIALFSVSREQLRLTRFTGIILLLYACVNFIRFSEALLRKGGPNDFMNTIPFEQLIMLVLLILLVLLTFSLSIMFNAFLYTDLNRQQNSLEELVATRDKLFSIIAHDLKSPFNSIMGFSGLLREKLSAGEVQEASKMALTIQESSHRASELVQNLLDWSQSQTGRLKITPESINVSELLISIIQLFEEIATQKQITFIQKIPDTLTWNSDRFMTSAIVRNLVSNALKFSYPGGNIEFRAESDGILTQLRVTDHGTGMTEEEQDKLFRIDQNFTKKGTANEKGTGLGLLICREFTEKQGGGLTIESASGVGSTFTVGLPG